MKKNKKIIVAILVTMTVVLGAMTFYISNLLTTPVSPTQIRKTKAAAVTYTRKVDLFPTLTPDEPTAAPTAAVTQIPTSTPQAARPTVVPTVTPHATPVILAQAPTSAPTSQPTKTPPTSTPIPTQPLIITMEPTAKPSPTLQPLLAYKSTSLSPTPAQSAGKGGTISPTTHLSPTKKTQPTGVQQLPETGWVQVSSILFIVAASTILFSLLF